LLFSTTNLGAEMEVDGTDVPIATTYAFAEPGEHLVKFRIMGDLTNQFRALSDLRKIYFPETTVGGAMNYLFYNVDKIQIIRIPSICVVPKLSSSATIRSSQPLADIELTNVTS
jgi:hypothetical protein